MTWTPLEGLLVGQDADEEAEHVANKIEGQEKALEAHIRTYQVPLDIRKENQSQLIVPKKL